MHATSSGENCFVIGEGTGLLCIGREIALNIPSPNELGLLIGTTVVESSIMLAAIRADAIAEAIVSPDEEQ